MNNLTDSLSSSLWVCHRQAWQPKAWANVTSEQSHRSFPYGHCEGRSPVAISQDGWSSLECFCLVNLLNPHFALLWTRITFFIILCRRGFPAPINPLFPSLWEGLREGIWSATTVPLRRYLLIPHSALLCFFRFSFCTLQSTFCIYILLPTS